mmetsp:Transcript_4328/g.12302  ORF Transcript_4328/g.12302 Transcript_4328/m.12302 type:complete len:177 (-) Transcript_4328:131-661(-)
MPSKSMRRSMRTVTRRKGPLPKWQYALVKAERWLGRGSPVTWACSGRGGLASEGRGTAGKTPWLLSPVALCAPVGAASSLLIKGLECSARRCVRRRRETTTEVVLHQSARSGSVESGKREDHGPSDSSTLPLHGLGLLRYGATGSCNARDQLSVIFILRLDWRCGGWSCRHNAVDL